MTSMSPLWLRMRRSALNLIEDCNGIAATEFAVIVPVMLVMFFGTVEISSGVAANRKVTLMARTLSDLTSQSASVDDTAINNFFAASTAILTPYDPAPTRSTITELFVDPATHAARVQWSKGSAPHAVTSTLVIPAQLNVDGTYVIFSEVSYLYRPAVGYVMGQAGVNLGDHAYTRPRQGTCVFYPVIPAGNPPQCPTL